MSAATPRVASNTPDQRQLLVALGALIVAVGLIVAVALARPMAVPTPAAPAAPAPIVFDHGWSQDVPSTYSAHDNGWASTDSAAPAAPGLVIRDTRNGGGYSHTGIPYTPSTGLAISGTNGGGLQYTGIPYSQSGSSETSGNGGNGTRFAR